LNTILHDEKEFTLLRGMPFGDLYFRADDVMGKANKAFLEGDYYKAL
jgi:hypothetical protein